MPAGIGRSGSIDTVGRKLAAAVGGACMASGGEDRWQEAKGRGQVA